MACHRPSRGRKTPTTPAPPQIMRNVSQPLRDLSHSGVLSARTDEMSLALFGLPAAAPAQNHAETAQRTTNSRLAPQSPHAPAPDWHARHNPCYSSSRRSRQLIPVRDPSLRPGLRWTLRASRGFDVENLLPSSTDLNVPCSPFFSYLYRLGFQKEARPPAFLPPPHSAQKFPAPSRITPRRSRPYERDHNPTRFPFGSLNHA